MPKAPKAPWGLKVLRVQPAKRDFLVFTAEMAILRVLQVMLDPRAPSAPSEHKVLPVLLGSKVPQVPQDNLGLKVTLAQLDNKVL